jgi:adenylate kinase family enzyme
MIISVTGAPASGKSTLGKALNEKYGWEYISTGDIARKVAKNDQAVQQALEEGQLSPIEGEIRGSVERLIDSSGGVGSPSANVKHHNAIVDGFPRYISQAEWLQDKIWQHYGSIDHVLVHLDVSTSVAEKRVADRKRYDDGILQDRQTNLLPLMVEFNQRYRHSSPFYLYIDTDEKSAEVVQGLVEKKISKVSQVAYRMRELNVMKGDGCLFNAHRIFDDINKSNLDRHLCPLPVQTETLWWVVGIVYEHIYNYVDRADLSHISIGKIRHFINLSLAESCKIEPKIAPVARSWFLYSQAHRYKQNFEFENFLSILDIDRANGEIEHEEDPVT